MSQFDAILTSSKLIQHTSEARYDTRQHIHSAWKEQKSKRKKIFKLKQMLMVCLFSMCSRGVEGHQNDKFFIYKTCEEEEDEKRAW